MFSVGFWTETDGDENRNTYTDPFSPNADTILVSLLGMSMRELLNRIPISVVIVVCLTLGLAPFTPQPHVWEKLQMLASGELSKPIDIFDLVLHGTPWILLLAKLASGKPGEAKE